MKATAIKPDPPYDTFEESAEADRIAKKFQPRQVAILRWKIIPALEALSLALAEESALHAEFEAAAPAQSGLLPRLGAQLGHCRLDHPHTMASAWAERIRGMGILS